jgi:multicomponent Na+:H+ antiporter subunit G
VHASSLIDSLGALLILTGLAVHSGMTFVTIKLMIILALLFITGPTAIHALVNTALHDDEKNIHPQQHKEPKDSSSNI